MQSLTADATLRPYWKVVGKMWNVCFWVDDAKASYQDFIARGVTIDSTLHEKTDGCLDFGIQDLDGHAIACGPKLDPGDGD